VNLAICFFCATMPAMILVNGPGLARSIDETIPRVVPITTFTLTSKTEAFVLKPLRFTFYSHFLTFFVYFPNKKKTYPCYNAVLG
jgi:hypothetical protein